MIYPVEFPLQAKRLSGATLFSTAVQRGRNGMEVRSGEWKHSLRRFDAALGIKTLTDQAALETFHMACDGALYGFLMKDWKDYKATRDLVTYAPGITQRGTVLQLTPTVFQLQKEYSHSARTHKRIITRPKAGTVFLYDISLSLIGAGYVLDDTTGQATFALAPGAPPKYWAGEFFCPARFEEDSIPWDIIKRKVEDGAGYGELPQIIISEVRDED